MSLPLENSYKLAEVPQGGILILDSGIGGVSFLPALNKQLPGVPLIAFADQNFFPYGDKSEQEIVDRMLYVSQFLVNILNPATILVACNTASTAVLPVLRNHFTIPIVGIVPAIKPAALQTKTKKIALLATPGTISRHYIQELINQFAKDCTVQRISSVNLAKLAEAKMINLLQVQEEVNKELLPLTGLVDYHEIDALVLGCTHFSFLQDEIAQALHKNLQIIDPIHSVTQQVKRVNSYKIQEDSFNTLIISKKIEGYINFLNLNYGIRKIIFL